MLPRSLRLYAEKIGDGNLSRGLCLALEAHRRAELFEVLSGDPKDGPAVGDDYDGECPECGGFAIYWHPDLDEWVRDPDAHYACENGHKK